MVEKAVNIKIKVSFQPLSKIKEIDFRCLKGYRLIKKNKDKVNWEHWDGDKTKSTHNPSSVNISQPQAQNFKKDKHHQRSR